MTEEERNQACRRNGRLQIGTYEVALTRVVIVRTWEGYLEVSARIGNPRMLAEAEQRVRDLVGTESVLVVQGAWPEDRPLPGRFWAFRLESRDISAIDQTHYRRILGVGCFTKTVDVSPYVVMEELLEKIDWESMTIPYEDDWD